MLFHLLLKADQSGVDTVKSAADRLIDNGVLGAVLVLVMAYAVWITYKHQQVQEKRIEDRDKMGDKLVGISENVRGAVREVAIAVEKACDGDRDVKTTLEKLSHSVETVVMEAVRGSLPPDTRRLDRESNSKPRRAP